MANRPMPTPFQTGNPVKARLPAVVPDVPVPASADPDDPLELEDPPPVLLAATAPPAAAVVVVESDGV
jgi:hypothetical protein